MTGLDKTAGFLPVALALLEILTQPDLRRASRQGRLAGRRSTYQKSLARARQALMSTGAPRSST